jgi:hypothetical protein
LSLPFSSCISQCLISSAILGAAFLRACDRHTTGPRQMRVRDRVAADFAEELFDDVRSLGQFIGATHRVAVAMFQSQIIWVSLSVFAGRDNVAQLWSATGDSAAKIPIDGHEAALAETLISVVDFSHPADHDHPPKETRNERQGGPRAIRYAGRNRDQGTR